MDHGWSEGERADRVHRIVFATDFSESSETAGRVAARYARQLGAELHILHVASPGEERVTSLLMGAAGDLSGTVPVVTAVEFGDPASAIVRYADQHRCDLVIVGTHGRTGLSRALLGSVAERVIRTARRPVLTVSAFPLEAALPPAEVPPMVQQCLVCAAPSADLICAPCRARIRGEALERKHQEERAGRI